VGNSKNGSNGNDTVTLIGIALYLIHRHIPEDSGSKRLIERNLDDDR
jgi:hypothetical protein